MKRFLMIGALLIGTLGVTACNPIGQKVEVPPASVGMVYGKNGYQGDVIPPSRFRLMPCFLNCAKLVVIEAGDIGMKESMEVLMPKDNLIFGVDVRFTLAMEQEKDKVLTVFDRVVPTRLDSGNYGTTLQTIYSTYGESIVRNMVRSEMSKYTISEVANNQQRVSNELYQVVSNALSSTPLRIKQFGLADLRYPTAVKEAMDATAERKIAVERAEADAQVQIRQAQARLEVTRAEREADILAAQTISEANRILADGVTPEVIRYLELEVLKRMADNENAVFFPVEMLGSDALNNRVMRVGETNNKVNE